jgi:hypothetical protein
MIMLILMMTIMGGDGKDMFVTVTAKFGVCMSSLARNESES